ncbi:MAG: HU family DNA-binding protein [Wolbachia endosymbiont of Tyrophagus putrescentiae]|nr:HU family DNA-binding protein [Wolbachia endosymbiont of Tyrophagus putrescentiae]
MATKSDIINKVVKKFPSFDKRVTMTVVDRFFEMLTETLEDHNRIEFRGFASFSIRSYNIKEEHSILGNFKKDKYFKVYFRSSKSLLNCVNYNSECK